MRAIGYACCLHVVLMYGICINTIQQLRSVNKSYSPECTPGIKLMNAIINL